MVAVAEGSGVGVKLGGAVGAGGVAVGGGVRNSPAEQALVTRAARITVVHRRTPLGLGQVGT
jgi:hypothetical protein